MYKLPNITVITLPFSDPAGEAILNNFLDLLEPLAGSIYIITSTLFHRPSNKIRILGVSATIGKKRAMILRIAWFVLAQIQYCYYLIKLSSHFGVVIFQFGTRLYLLPLLLTKLLSKRVIIVATGRQSHSARTEFGWTMWGFGGLLLPTIFRIIENVGFSLSSQIAALSESSITTLELNKYRDKITISGSQYVDTNKYRGIIPLSRRGNTVGYIGNLGLRKGVLQFIQAMPLILKSHSDTEFLIGGVGPLLQQIEGMLERDGLSGKVQLTGWIPQEKLPELLNKLKIIVLPSEVEGLPAIIQQAMACEVIALATAVGGIPDLIKDGETGFILKNNSPECIADTVIKAMQYKDLDQIGERSRLLIEHEYGYEISARKCAELLSDTTKVSLVDIFEKRTK